MGTHRRHRIPEAIAKSQNKPDDLAHLQFAQRGRFFRRQGGAELNCTLFANGYFQNREWNRDLKELLPEAGQILSNGIKEGFPRRRLLAAIAVFEAGQCLLEPRMRNLLGECARRIKVRFACEDFRRLGSLAAKKRGRLAQ